MPAKYAFEIAVLGTDWDFTQSLTISLNTHGFKASPLTHEEGDPDFLKSLAQGSRRGIIFLVHCDGLDEKILRCLQAIERWLPPQRVLFIAGGLGQALIPHFFSNPALAYMEKPVTCEQVAAGLIALNAKPAMEGYRT